MAAPSQNQKPHDQAQLLEKFRKLRQWQQQQQDSMLRQQQQQMETLKMEQNKLQSILAAQKRLQEQQSTSSLTAVRSPNLGTTSSQADTMRQSPMTAQSQPQPIARVQVPMSMVTRGEVESDGYELGGDNFNVLPRSIPTSSAPPIVMSQGDLEVQMRHVDSQQYYGAVPQFTANVKERFEGSLASFNQTVYPMMWNSSNYRLPLGAIPLSAGTRAVPFQGQHVLSSTNPNNLMTEAPPSFQSPVSTQELGRLWAGYNPATDSHNLENVRESNAALQCHKAPVMTQELERLWSHNPGVESLADVDSQVDEQSEVDAMSGVYPLYDSEPELGVNEMEEVNVEEDMDSESEVEEELEETLERNTTVIELETHRKDATGMVSYLRMYYIRDCTNSPTCN